MNLECFAYSVGHGDDGICLLARIGPHRILLDCGIADISLLTNTNENKQVVPADIVLCTHAHSDHAQGLLALNQAFPQLPIYMLVKQQRSFCLSIGPNFLSLKSLTSVNLCLGTHQ
ncbi:hypothetical protein CYANOKiyG1_55880 [Okeania sp. KiyG1]|nr:hypothetical protein CYANOKiyG1_55880 [Okeania sp. KiyG1]